jgi:hypothetical protein
MWAFPEIPTRSTTFFSMTNRFHDHTGQPNGTTCVCDPCLALPMEESLVIERDAMNHSVFIYRKKKMDAHINTQARPRYQVEQKKMACP